VRIRMSRRTEQAAEYAILFLLIVCMGTLHATIQAWIIACVVYFSSMMVLRRFAVPKAIEAEGRDSPKVH
jgi:hypothetical protein